MLDLQMVRPELLQMAYEHFRKKKLKLKEEPLRQLVRRSILQMRRRSLKGGLSATSLAKRDKPQDPRVKELLKELDRMREEQHDSLMLFQQQSQTGGLEVPTHIDWGNYWPEEEPDAEPDFDPVQIFGTSLSEPDPDSTYQQEETRLHSFSDDDQEALSDIYDMCDTWSNGDGEANVPPLSGASESDNSDRNSDQLSDEEALDDEDSESEDSGFWSFSDGYHSAQTSPLNKPDSTSIEPKNIMGLVDESHSSAASSVSFSYASFVNEQGSRADPRTNHQDLPKKDSTNQEEVPKKDG
eukprot:Platyproteum_vivax@DN12017_c0_g1_i1.p1